MEQIIINYNEKKYTYTNIEEMADDIKKMLSDIDCLLIDRQLMEEDIKALVKRNEELIKILKVVRLERKNE